MFAWYSLAVVLFALVIAAVPHAAAQVLYGSLTGNVADGSGAAVPEVKVEALNNNTGVSRSTNSDSTGVYIFNDLQPGAYKITFKSSSFAAYVHEAVPINANSQRRLDVQMQLAQVSESVLVSASAVSLQTDRADVNNVIPQTQIANLPFTGNAGRNFQALYKLVPGVQLREELHSDAGNPQRSLGANVNGASYSNNNTKLDGATVSYPWLPHIVAYVPPADAVEAVNIVTNSFDAEQGMAGGAAINVSIKSGTNDFHGTAHWFHTNSAFRARNFFFLGSKVPKNILNQAGGTIGGPVKRNKLFFFADWERTVRREFRSAFRTIPFAAISRGDFSGSGTTIYDPRTGSADGSGREPFPNNIIPPGQISSAAARMLSLLPAPNTNTFPNNYQAAGSYEFDRDNMDFKVNYNPTDKSSMFFRYSYSPSEIFDPPSLGAAGGDALAGGQPGNAPGRIHSASLGATYTVTPRLLLDWTAGYTRQQLAAENVDIDRNYGLDELNIPGTNGSDRLQGGYPRFTFSNGLSALGNPNVSNPFLFRDNQYVTNGNVSYIAGSHNLRFGAEYAYYAINHFQPQTSFGPRGGFSFTGGLTALRNGTAPNIYNSAADFLLGLPQSMGKDIQFINPSAVRMPGYGFYARDQWQATRKLTLNYGFRLERYPFGRRDHRGGERYDPETNLVLIGGLGDVPEDTGVDVPAMQFAPRLGIAYRVTDRTVIRAGYGISIDPDSYRRMRDSYPAVISLQIGGATAFQAAGDLRIGLPPVTGPDVSSGRIELPRAVGTLTWPEEFRRGYFQSFNFTIQTDIGLGFNVQTAYVGTRGIRQTAIHNINYGTPGSGNSGRVLAQRWGRIANIEMYTPFNTSTYNGWQNQLTRRLGNGGTFGLIYTWSKAISYADNNDTSLNWNWPELWDRNRALAGFDRTHNLQIYAVYTLPFGKGQRYANSGIPSRIIGGWQVNGVFSATTGLPFTVESAGTSVDAPGNLQTADQVRPEVKTLGKVGRGESWFDPDAFAPVTAVRFGNSGRNILRGPGLTNLDASIFRDFPLTESWKLQFRAEAFNVSNTPLFELPGRTVSTAQRNPNGTIRALNNFTEVTVARNTERQFRFALKLMF